MSEGTVRNWLAKGETGDPVYQAFMLECAASRAVMKDAVIEALFKTACDELHPQQTKAAHQLLTNLYPVEFSSVRHVVSHQAKPEEIDLAKLPTDELRAFRKTLLRLRADGEPKHTPTTEAVIDVIEANASTSPKAN